VDAQTSRRAFLGLAAAGVAGTATACGNLARPAAGRPAAATARPWRNPVPENALPGTSEWVIRHLGGDHEIEGYAGKASILTGESLPLFVSTTARGFTATAYRLGWYQGHGARQVWKSRTVRGGAQRSASVADATNTVTTDWDPALHVPTDDWPPGAYLVKLDAESGAQRYVPVTVRSASCAGKVVLKSCVQTWQAYNLWGGYDLYKGPSGAYTERSLVVSLDRPYDTNGANMFLTYERNVVKLAEFLTTQKGGLDLAYVTSMDIDADPRLLDGASALVSMGHDEYWTPQERANVTAARDKGVNLAFLGANALFRRTRLQPTALGDARAVVCYKTAYRQDPVYAKDPAEVTSDWREPPNSDPESTLIGTMYEGYPVDAPFVVSAPGSWVYQGTGVSAGASFPHLVGVEYDRVNPAYPLQRPIEVLSHSPLTCGGVASYGDSAYYTHSSGAGVYNSGTMRWVEAIYGDQPHGIGGATPAFVRQVTTNVLRGRARRGQAPGQRQPGRHPRARRQPDRPRQPSVGDHRPGASGTGSCFASSPPPLPRAGKPVERAARTRHGALAAFPGAGGGRYWASA
jgi:N,N-dimethylformamidase beta subunit-like protein